MTRLLLAANDSDASLLSQLELPISRPRVPDRNADKGGRSFYFFDFDDNVMRLNTCIYIFNRRTGAELPLSTRRFAASPASRSVRPSMGAMSEFSVAPNGIGAGPAAGWDGLAAASWPVGVGSVSGSPPRGS